MSDFDDETVDGEAAGGAGGGSDPTQTAALLEALSAADGPLSALATEALAIRHEREAAIAAGVEQLRLAEQMSDQDAFTLMRDIEDAKSRGDGAVLAESQAALDAILAAWRFEAEANKAEADQLFLGQLAGSLMRDGRPQDEIEREVRRTADEMADLDRLSLFDGSDILREHPKYIELMDQRWEFERGQKGLAMFEADSRNENPLATQAADVEQWQGDLREMAANLGAKLGGGSEADDE